MVVVKFRFVVFVDGIDELLCLTSNLQCCYLPYLNMANNNIGWDCLHQVVGIMRVNVEKVLERDQKLSELDTRAGNSMLEELLITLGAPAICGPIIHTFIFTGFSSLC